MPGDRWVGGGGFGCVTVQVGLAFFGAYIAWTAYATSGTRSAEPASVS